MWLDPCVQPKHCLWAKALHVAPKRNMRAWALHVTWSLACNLTPLACHPASSTQPNTIRHPTQRGKLYPLGAIHCTQRGAVHCTHLVWYIAPSMVQYIALTFGVVSRLSPPAACTIPPHRANAVQQSPRGAPLLTCGGHNPPFSWRSCAQPVGHAAGVASRSASLRQDALFGVPKSSGLLLCCQGVCAATGWCCCVCVCSRRSVQSAQPGAPFLY